MDEIFVFGSNLAGRHGKGAAADAHKWYGAEYGVGKGPTGQAYALPTKNEKLEVLWLVDIEGYIKDFLEYANGNPKKRFHVTPIGTGLAGYTKREIASLFKGKKIPSNVVFTKEWFE